MKCTIALNFFFFCFSLFSFTFFFFLISFLPPLSLYSKASSRSTSTTLSSMRAKFKKWVGRCDSW